MKYSKVGFREIYHKFCLFQMTDTIRKALQFFPGADEANAVLTYGYIDHEAGLTVEILCACKYDERELSGMVINAFTTPVELPLEVVVKMRELLLKMKEDGTIE